MERRHCEIHVVQLLSQLSDQDAAGKALMDLLNVSHLAQSGDGYLVHYLVATGVYTKAMDAVNVYAFHPQSSSERLKEIRRWLQRTRPDAQALARAFQMEVGYFEQEISRLSAIAVCAAGERVAQGSFTLDGDSRGAEIQAAYSSSSMATRNHSISGDGQDLQ